MIRSRVRPYAIGETFGNSISQNKRRSKGECEEHLQIEYSTVIEEMEGRLETLYKDPDTTNLPVLLAIHELMERMVDGSIADIK